MGNRNRLADLSLRPRRLSGARQPRQDRHPLPLSEQQPSSSPSSSLLRTSWSSACAASDQMTAPPDQATAWWSRSQRPWIRSVPTQDSDRGCSEWAVQQTRCAGGMAHIQACAAWARHGCFGSRGWSGLAMPLPRTEKRVLAAAYARSGRPPAGAGVDVDGVAGAHSCAPADRSTGPGRRWRASSARGGRARWR